MARPSIAPSVVVLLALAACASPDETLPDEDVVVITDVTSASTASTADDFQRSTDVADVAASIPTTTPPPSPSTTATTSTSSTTASTTTTTTATPTTTTTTTTTTTSTLPPGTPSASLDLSADSVLLGTSVAGRPIVAERFGSAGGRRVLVIGVIHGDEDAGVAIVDDLRRRSLDGLPNDLELWLVASMNPDGQIAQDRHNQNDVDLNRNFPYRWGPIGAPGDTQYAGPGPASEPETRATTAFISQLAPELVLWYHQDANLMIPSTGRDGRARARYAELTGLPMEDCCDGGIYTGIAATWARNEAVAPDGLAFIVELPGGELTAEQVDRHATAVLTVAAELGSI